MMVVRQAGMADRNALLRFFRAFKQSPWRDRFPNADEDLIDRFLAASVAIPSKFGIILGFHNERDECTAQMYHEIVAAAILYESVRDHRAHLIPTTFVQWVYIDPRQAPPGMADRMQKFADSWSEARHHDMQMGYVRLEMEHGNRFKHRAAEMKGYEYLYSVVGRRLK